MTEDTLSFADSYSDFPMERSIVSFEPEVTYVREKCFFLTVQEGKCDDYKNRREKEKITYYIVLLISISYSTRSTISI